MPRATCRCGQQLSFPADGPERVICPKCSARIRVRRDPPKPAAGSGTVAGDGFVRFACPCGRRLKVRGGADAPQAGKCPDCGRVVPVPGSPASSGALKLKPNDPETPTQELSAVDLAVLDRWSRAHLASAEAPAAGGARNGREAAEPAAPAAGPAGSVISAVKIEAGLRVCPRCGRPVHLSAVTCRECGATVPKR